MGQRQVFSWASALNQQTLETTLVCPRALRVGCLHLREISQPQVIQYGCTHRTPCHLRPSISPTCVSISGWLATATSDAGVRRAAIRRTGCCPAAGALTSAMFSAICTVDSLLQTLRQSVPPWGAPPPPSVTEVQSTLDPAPLGGVLTFVMPANFRRIDERARASRCPRTAHHMSSPWGAVPRWRARPS
jgi:hypothetical protein